MLNLQLLIETSHIHQGKLKTVVYLSSGRKRLHSELQSSDIIFTTYETMRRDWVEKGLLFANSWYRVVLDEGMYKYRGIIEL